MHSSPRFDHVLCELNGRRTTNATPRSRNHGDTAFVQDGMDTIYRHDWVVERPGRPGSQRGRLPAAIAEDGKRHGDRESTRAKILTERKRKRLKTSLFYRLGSEAYNHLSDPHLYCDVCGLLKRALTSAGLSRTVYYRVSSDVPTRYLLQYNGMCSQNMFPRSQTTLIFL